MVRLVDPKRGEILQLNADGTFSDRVLPCSPVWNHGKRCSRCISCRCMEDKTRMSKLELTDECAYQLISRYLVVDGRECVLELGSRLSDSVWVTSGGRQFRLDASHGEDFYLDPVTGAYGRRYLEDQQPELEKAEALAVIDIDNFKEINDEYGHLAGDAVLRHVANVILARATQRTHSSATAAMNLCCCCRISRRRNSVRHSSTFGEPCTQLKSRSTRISTRPSASAVCIRRIR